MRFLTALAALGEGEYLLTGTERLCQRPLGELLDSPGPDRGPGRLRKRRRLPPGQGHRRPHRRPGPALRRHQQPVPVGPAVHRASGARRAWRSRSPASLVSRPYVDLTLEVLGDFGITYYREGYRFFQLPGGQCYLPQDYEIEADASSASYFWAAAALTGGRVTITNLSLESSQGDAAFPEVLGRMGCAIESTPAGLTVTGRAAHRG